MNRMTWDDPRIILPAIISYGRIENRALDWDGDMNDRTFCDSAWNEAELNCQSSASQVIGFPFPSWLSTSPNVTSAADEFISCTLDNLQPATTYSAYITIATLVKHEGAQSGRFNFTTKPATPSVPTYLHAVSVDPTSIQLLWSPPARPNGKIVFYKILPFHQHSSPSSSNEFSPNKGGESIDGGGSGSSSGEDRDDGESDDGFCQAGADGSHSECSSTNKEPKQPEFLTEELRRREMIRFEDELHKAILIPRVIQRFPEQFNREELIFEFGSHNVRRRRDITSSHSEQQQPALKTIQVAAEPHDPRSNNSRPAVGIVNEDSAGGLARLTYVVTGLEHFTEYLFYISACHKPHDEFGNSLPCSEEDNEFSQDRSCSLTVQISQRTQAFPHADEVLSSSLYALTPISPTSSSTFASDSMSSAAKPSISGQPPDPLANLSDSATFSVNNSTLFSHDISSDSSNTAGQQQQQSVKETATPWFTICVRPKYLEDGAAIKALAARRCGNEKGERNLASSPTARTVYTELGFVRAGYYEWQVMAVSLAGNGSWTKTRFFDVKVGHGLQPCKLILSLSNYSSTHRLVSSITSSN
ncbi:unnamed protein product [Hymenolepis diminuta]|uniref:Fibronectin type-III domain-containing protein n=1 Tax=Hymenolepis diminuta TaxID=6216 RepID=A0A0R3SX10_HYMDI|nr:unnamed protein product [Hymenolepis diminuta]